MGRKSRGAPERMKIVNFDLWKILCFCVLAYCYSPPSVTTLTSIRYLLCPLMSQSIFNYPATVIYKALAVGPTSTADPEVSSFTVKASTSLSLLTDTLLPTQMQVARWPFIRTTKTFYNFSILAIVLFFLCTTALRLVAVFMACVNTQLNSTEIIFCVFTTKSYGRYQSNNYR